MKRGWSRNSAMVGALGWTAMCAYAGAGKAPLGVIELLLLFAALVVVPLGLALGDGIAPAGTGRVMHVLEIFQPFAAISLASSFWITPGPFAATLALPWVLLCWSIALIGAWSLRAPSLSALAVNIGRMDLAVAATGLLASRFGLRPLGIEEPRLLGIVFYFQYVGFASVTILAAALRTDKRVWLMRSLRWSAVLVLSAPFLVASSLMIYPFLAVAGVLDTFVATVGLAIIQIILARSVISRPSRVYLCISSISVAVEISVIAFFAAREWLGRDLIVIPYVEEIPFVLYALGFSLCGILGWLIEFAPTSSQSGYFTADDHAMVGMK